MIGRKGGGRPMVPVYIRWAIIPDLPALTAMERGAWGGRGWGEEAFRHALRARNCIGMVAECEGVVIGYVVYELYERALRLLRIGVDADWRRLGVGSQMVAKLQGKLTGKRCWLVADVPDDLLPVHLFFASCGLRAKPLDRSTYRFAWRVPAGELVGATDQPQRGGER